MLSLLFLASVYKDMNKKMISKGLIVPKWFNEKLQFIIGSGDCHRRYKEKKIHHDMHGCRMSKSREASMLITQNANC